VDLLLTVLLVGVAASLSAFAAEAKAQQGLRIAPAGSEAIPDRYICAYSGAYVPGRYARAAADRMARSVGATVRRVDTRSFRA